MRYFKLIKYVFLAIVYTKIRRRGFNDFIFRAVSDMGGMYVKLAQFVALRTSLFPDTDKIRFLSFYDRVPKENVDLNKTILRELKRNPLEIFDSIEPEPFACGSFAQVYRGVYKGRDVVIKIQKEGLKFKLVIDFFVISVIAKIIDVIYSPRQANLPQLIKDFKVSTYNELDYLEECNWAERFLQAYTEHPSIVIPAVFKEICTNRVIVEQYIDGVSLTSLVAMKARGEDYRKWAQEHLGTDMMQIFWSIVYQIARDIFQRDFYYADPHPGNILILKDNRYAIIDFGIVGRSPRNKQAYYQLIEQSTKRVDEMDLDILSGKMLEFASEDLMCSLVTLNNIYIKENSSLTAQVTALFSNILKEKKELLKKCEIGDKEIDMTDFFIELMRMGEKFGLKLPEGMFVLGRTTQMFKSYMLYLEPNERFVRKVNERIIAEIDPKQLLEPVNQVHGRYRKPENALEYICNWVGNLGDAEESMYYKIRGILGNR